MNQKQIAICAFEDDLHALAIQKKLSIYEDVTCYIFETDRICNRAVVNWFSENICSLKSTLTAKNEDCVDVNELDVVWWRRTMSPQKIPAYVEEPVHIDLINNDCSTALLGTLMNEFSGSWISHPAASRLAENKLLQLRAAQKAGFRVPKTLISQDPVSIRQFCAALDNQVIIKPVKGTKMLPMLTQKITEEHLASDQSLRLCPAIYQEYIPGNLHVRAHCFGADIYSVLVESERLDWRQNLEVPFSIFELEEDVQVRLRRILNILGLKMGIVDLKLTHEGEPVWLEINQQGQFLFAQGLTGLDLISLFAKFLYQEAKQASHKRMKLLKHTV